MRILRFSISVLLLVLWACSSHEEFEPPDNPFDPGNPDYVSPAAEIISGPGEGEVIDTTGVTFTWQGNETATEYSYQFDGSDWSEWSISTSAEFEYLDEGDHTFRVLARSVNGDEQETPAVVEFIVDAMGGPTALVYPYRLSGSPGDTLIYYVVAEEVTDLFALECTIEFDDRVELIEVVNGNILSEWGGNLLVIMDSQPGYLNLSIASVEGTNTSFTGTSTIVSLVVRIKPSTPENGMFNAIIPSDVTYLRPNIERITTLEPRVGVIDVY